MKMVVGMSSGLYSKDVTRIDEDTIDDLNEFTSVGDPVIFCDDLADLAQIGINPDTVIEA